MMLRNERLDQRQWIVIFIAGVTLCFIFFAFGLFIGRWTAGGSVNTAAVGTPGSLLPTGSEPAPSLSASDQSPSTESEGTPESPSPPEKAPDSSASQQGIPAPGVGPAAEAHESSSETHSVQTPASKPPTPGQTVRAPKVYYVRAGTFARFEEAEQFAATLHRRGFVSAYTTEETSEAGVRRYLVLLGPWVDHESAARTMSELRNEGVSNVTIVSR